MQFGTNRLPYIYIVIEQDVSIPPHKALFLQPKNTEVLLMSIHNIHFHGEIKKIISGPSCSKHR